MDEFEIRAVMDHTGCDYEEAVRALEWSRCRIGVAIRRIKGEEKSK